MQNEDWLPVKGFEKFYEVSNKGRVRSKRRMIADSQGRTYGKEGRILQQCETKSGYLKVNLSVEGGAHSKRVHRLVAEAFLENPDNKMEVNHKNGNKKDNCTDNLEWSTSSENKTHAFNTGLRKGKRGQASHFSKISNLEAEFIRYWASIGCKQSEICQSFGLSPSSVSMIVNNKTYKTTEKRKSLLRNVQ